jgi:hypothetical protein
MAYSVAESNSDGRFPVRTAEEARSCSIRKNALRRAAKLMDGGLFDHLLNYESPWLNHLTAYDI